LGLRQPRIFVAAAAIALGALHWAPADANTVTVSAKATVVKPLVLSSVQDLDLGTLLLGPGSWSGSTVTLSSGGAVTCPSNVTCSGATRAAIYNVQGSNKQTVMINAPNVTLVNQSNPSSTLTLILNSPASVFLTNSGAPGMDFSIGGSISLNSTTASGQYSGTLEVTAEYQ
jgi:hypothetical protein